MEYVENQEIYFEYADDVAQYFLNQVDEDALSTEEHILLQRKIKIFNLERLLTTTKFWRTVVNNYESKMISHIEKLQNLAFSLDFTLPATTTAAATSVKVNDFVKEIREETQAKPATDVGTGATGASSLSSTIKPSSGPAPATTTPAPTQRVSGKLFQTTTTASVAASAAMTATSSVEKAAASERHYISVKTRKVFADYKIKITVEEASIDLEKRTLPNGLLDWIEMGYDTGFDVIGVEIWAIRVLWGSLAVVLGLI